MPDLAIHLLGPPRLERDGEVVPPPRGLKAWAVLAYLVLAERPVPRARLAALLFADADDPLGALRWTLAQLRRALGLPDALRGDPLTADLAPGTVVDVLELGTATDGAVTGAPRGELLEGVEANAGAVFDAWLLVERLRLVSLAQAALRDAAHAALAAGDPLTAAGLAAQSLEADEFDEDTHELLVRSLARAGQVGAARDHAGACVTLFRRELGRDPDPRVRHAAGDVVPALPDRGGDRTAAEDQLAAGRAALDAGAVEPGLACLRLACAEARAVGDPALLTQVLAVLGAALVHAVRGRDEEGAAVLHEALALAEARGDRPLAAKVCRELGFVDVQAGRAGSAGHWLLRAGTFADADDERAAILGIRGMALSDRAHYASAEQLLQESVACARRAGDARQAAWSLAILGRAHLLCGRMEAAIDVLDESLRLIADERWIAMQPFPEALRAEVAMTQGETDLATGLLDHAFSLGCRLGDPCWEAMAARSRGLLLRAAGDGDAAIATLHDAVTRAARVADPYVWIRAYCLDALVETAIDHGAPEAPDLAEELGHVAARGDMRELVVRAALHHGRLGDPNAVSTARLLGDGIDNPRLQAALAAAA